MIESEWLKLPQGFKNVQLHKYMVMPNHFHVGATLVVALNQPRRPKNTVAQTNNISQTRTIAQNGNIDNNIGKQNNDGKEEGQPQGLPLREKPLGIW